MQIQLKIIKIIASFFSLNRGYIIAFFVASAVKWIYTIIMWAYNFDSWRNPVVYKSVAADFVATIPIIFLIIILLNWINIKKSRLLVIFAISITSIVSPVILLLFSDLVRLVVFPELIEPINLGTISGWFFRNFFFFFMLNVIYYYIWYQKRYYRQKEEMIDSDTKVKEALLKTFLYQVNPKFLFSTLNSLDKLIDCDKETAKRLVVNLSEYYRDTLNKHENYVPIEKEIDSLKQYLNILQVSNENNFEYNIQVENNCSFVKLPSFILHFVIDTALTNQLEQVESLEKLLVNIKCQSLGTEVEAVLSIKPGSTINTVTNLQEKQEQINNYYGNQITLESFTNKKNSAINNT